LLPGSRGKHAHEGEATMAIITISRGSFSGGKMLAEALARRLGYRYIDRNQVIRKAAEWGVSQDDLRTAIEKPPSFFGQSQHTKYIYLAFIQAALAEDVRHGDAIYHGLAGHLLLGKGLHILRTRIIAPMEFRVAQVQERMNLKRKEAVEYIETVDADRRKWTRFLYGVDWADASLYDVVLNLEQMSIEEACEGICALAQSKSFQPTAETLAAIEDLALASCVKANLAMNPATCDLQFEVAARSGSVSVRGDIDTPGQAKKIRAFVEAIPGVSKLNLEELALTNRL
jgi:cytidylate kinase